MKKNILLIGGSSGIGLSLVNQISQDHNVYVACRSNSTLPENVNYINYDVLNDELDSSLVPETIDSFIYLPGSINLRPFKSLSIESFKEDLEINLIGLIKSLKSVLKNLTASNSASIVLFSTVAVQRGMPFHSSVSSSKGAIEGLAKSLAAELSPKIRVNVIAPSLVNTPLANRFLNNDIKIEKSANRHPLKRIGSASDIANLTDYLISDKSSWITGQIIAVDGGLSTIETN
ncbi:MAG: oxidoreductase [Flavobacteriaceae bacterium]|jgi:NAD(P)-dependent dehydrogenase (short-subunit alcohol dehydrogenase family)|nr:oxidoreductase [Flavobacteriaceae bacterium]